MAEQLKITFINILEDRESNYRKLEEVKYTEDGKLLVERCAVGKAVRGFWGDNDYERDTIVSAKEVPRVLMLLIEERFQRASEFDDWLILHDIDANRYLA